jgi:hypothetical protein
VKVTVTGEALGPGAIVTPVEGVMVQVRLVRGCPRRSDISVSVMVVGEPGGGDGLRAQALFLSAVKLAIGGQAVTVM